MKDNARKELLIGILLFSLFNIVNFIRLEIGREIPILHFFLGLIAGLAFVQVIIGILPESLYLKLKNFKKSIIRL